MGKVVIFDFDGTLADTAPLIINVYNSLAQKRGWRIVRPKDIPKLRLGGIRDAAHWAGIRFWQWPRLIMDGRKLFKLEAETVKLFPGIAELVSDLKKDGHKIYILSRNKKEVLEPVLKKYSVTKNVTILKSTSFFGGKHKTIQGLISAENFRPSETWMIGDETRDIEAAKKAGVHSIAVTWGLQDESILRMHKPTHVAHTPKEVGILLKEGKK